MAYIGKTPQVGNYQKCDAITTSATDTFNLLVNTVAVSPESANHCIVSLNGVIQEPGISAGFTISGSTIVFNSALTTSDTIDFILLLGSTLDIGVPSDDTCGAAQIKDDLISGTTALAVAPADTDEFLVSDAGTLKRIDYSLIKGGGITEADQWRMTADLTSSDWTITSNLERSDTAGFSVLGTGMTESSGVFTFPSTGYWWIMFSQYVVGNADNRVVYARIATTHDDGTYAAHYSADSVARVETNYTGSHCSVNCIFDVTDVSTHKCKFTGSTSATTVIVAGHTGVQTTGMTFIRLGDT